MPTLPITIAAIVAPAVAAPVANRVGDVMEPRVVRADGTPLTSGDVVGWIETEGGQMPKGTTRLAIIDTAQRVAGVLDHVETVRGSKRHHRIHLNRIPEDMGNENRTGPVGQSRFQQIDVDVVGPHLAVDEDRNQTVLHNRRDGRGEGRRRRDDLIAGLQWAVQLRGPQRRHRHQVARGTGVDREDVLEPQVCLEVIGERLCTRSIGEPEVQDRLDAGLQLTLVIDAPTVIDERLTGHKGSILALAGVCQAVVLAHLRKDLLPQARDIGIIRHGHPPT